MKLVKQQIYNKPWCQLAAETRNHPHRQQVWNGIVNNLKENIFNNIVNIKFF